jgi:4-hydroxy-tetrahydrodipicolinate reductase
MIKLAISGARGRMGRAISSLAFADQDFKVITLLERPGHPEADETVNGVALSTDNDAIKGCDALIEFTLPEGTLRNLEACVRHNVRVVIGTTGLTADQTKQIEAASQKIPIVFSTNMSIGVNVLFKLIELAGKKIGPCSITINETHHIHKKDAPSGTAKTMAEIAREASGRPVTDIRALREGEVIGDHDIIFETAEDILTLKHHARNRDMFARGALTAAKFLRNKTSGLYHMQDVLGLSQIKI